MSRLRSFLLFFVASIEQSSEALCLQPISDVDAMSLPNAASNASSIQVLASILNEIGAPEYLQAFIDDDRDDNSLKTLASLSVERILQRFGLPVDAAAAFKDKCQAIICPLPSEPSPAQDLFARHTILSDNSESSPSSSLTTAGNSTPDDAAIIRMLKFEMIRELDRGAFGIVYEAMNLTDKTKAALKIVKGPENAAEAIREGQKLRHVNHKNIVRMHRVHDDIGKGACALEMEIVPGGDLSKHLEACRLPHDAVLRFSRQLLGALAYLHDEKKWIYTETSNPRTF